MLVFEMSVETSHLLNLKEFDLFLFFMFSFLYTHTDVMLFYVEISFGVLIFFYRYVLATGWIS